MIPAVNVTLVNGQIGGSIGTNDNTCGMVLTGAGTGTLPLLAPIKVVSVVDAISQGVTLAVEPEAYKFVNEFYSIPGTFGVGLYLMLAADTTTLVSLCDGTVSTGVKKLADFAQGAIRVMGVSRTPGVGYTPPTAKFLDSDVFAAIPNAQILAQAAFNAHTPYRILIAARINDVANVTIDTPNTQTDNKVGLVLGSSLPDGLTSMGIILGRVAATAPQVNIGRVADGALPVTSWFLGDLPILPDLSNPTAPWYEQISQLINSGFITVTNYPQVAGLFISDDPMAVAASDDYCSLANGRVIDKASIVTYKTYTQNINDDVDLDSNNLLAPVVVAALEDEITNALNLNMAASMSGDAIVYIDPSQPIVSTSLLNITLRVQPKGYLKIIDVNLGFNNPLNTN